MAIHLAFYLLLLNLPFSIATTRSLNETCLDGGTTIILEFGWYQNTCPEAEPIIFSIVEQAIINDPRMAASLLRLHFHDCFVNGCDGSVLLDDTPSFVGEKTATPNLNSLRGFEVIDSIKTAVEDVCPQVVSCADILAIAARDSVVLSGGPSWEVQTGRRDALSASKTAANNNLPGPNSDVPTLLSKFQNVGLDINDMVALSGAHTLGKARCATFTARLNNSFDPSRPNVNSDFIGSLQQLCSGSAGNTANLDLITPSTFDNQYFINLVSGEGLLPSDQVLVTGDDLTREIVNTYANDPFAFFEEFRRSMMKMGRLGALTGVSGEIRRKCRAVN